MTSHRIARHSHRLPLLVATLALALPGIPALAICTGPLLYGTQSDAYVYTPGVDPFSSASQTSMTDDAHGSFWAMGFGHPELHRGIDNGGLPGWAGLQPEQNEAFIYGYAGYPAIVTGHWGASQAIDGCISNAGDGDECMLMLLTDQHDATGYFALLGATHTGTYQFVFSPEPAQHFDLAPLPVPDTTSVRPRGAGDVALTVPSPTVGPGLFLAPGCQWLGAPVIGYRVYQQRLEPGALPDADRSRDAGWFGTSTDGACGEPPFTPLGQAAEIDIACEQDTDVVLALSLVFDGGFETPFVSADSSVIPCRRCAAGTDDDGDGFCKSATGAAPADCDDTNAAVYPGAIQACDGINNDCADPIWPAVAANELDDDGDGYAACAKTIVLELAADNCPGVANPDQRDTDGDGIGDACDPDSRGGRDCNGRTKDCRPAP